MLVRASDQSKIRRNGKKKIKFDSISGGEKIEKFINILQATSRKKNQGEFARTSRRGRERLYLA